MPASFIDLNKTYNKQFVLGKINQFITLHLSNNYHILLNTYGQYIISHQKPLFNTNVFLLLVCSSQQIVLFMK